MNSTRTTHFITTAPTGITYYAIRLPGLRLLELVSEDGTAHYLLTPEQAKGAGFARCRPADAAERFAAEDALAAYRHTRKLAHERAHGVTGWREVQHDGRTWWARELPGGALEAVTPAGDATITITADLAPGRAIDSARAEAALRTARLLATVKKAPAAAVRRAPAPTPTPEQARSSYAAHIEGMVKRGLLRRGTSAWS